MNGNRYLLDTNIVVPLLNQDLSLLKKVERLPLYISVITLGELDFGARKSDQIPANLARIEPSNAGPVSSIVMSLLLRYTDKSKNA